MATKTTTTKTTETRYDSAAEDAYWRENHGSRPYVARGMTFDEDYLPAYRYGVAVSDKHENQAFDRISTHVESGWAKAKGQSRLSWDQARPAVQDAYDRVIRVYEERLKVDKQEVQAGEARLRKEVRTEHQEVTVPVQREELVVERHAVNKVVGGDPIRAGAEEVKVQLTEEHVTAAKETVLKEEVSVGKKTVTEQKTVGADLKKEELVVEEEGTAKVRRTGDKGK
jgi:uncharacterized protein (TIGR02271 family)